jgi:RNA polymerase sigma-32 factor
MNSRLENQGSFRLYKSQVDRIPELEREDELDLARRYRAGDRQAGDALVEAHLRSVVRIARKFSGYGIPVAELVGEGNIGLLEAVRRYEPERNLRFLTYARYWIRATILAYVLKHWSIVDMGTNALQSKLFFRLQAERSRLENELGGEDASIDAQLAATFNTSEDNVRASLQRLRGRDASLDAPLSDEVGTTFLDLLRDDGESAEVQTANAEMASFMRGAVADLWPTLDDREHRIVCERLLGGDDGVSLADLGRELGVTRERVRQIEVSLKAKLKVRLTELLDGAPRLAGSETRCPCPA